MCDRSPAAEWESSMKRGRSRSAGAWPSRPWLLRGRWTPAACSAFRTKCERRPAWSIRTSFPFMRSGPTAASYFYAMRFIDGPNLAEVIAQLRDRIGSVSGAGARTRGNHPTPPRSATTIRDRSAVVGRAVAGSNGSLDPTTGDLGPHAESLSFPTAVGAIPSGGNDAVRSLLGAAVRRNFRTWLESEHIRRVVRLADRRWFSSARSTTPTSGAWCIAISNPRT